MSWVAAGFGTRGWGALVGRGTRVDSDGDGGRRRDCGDGLAVGGGVRGLAAIGGVPPVARRVLPVAMRAVVAPSPSRFKSVRARLGWGRRLPVQLAL